MNETWTRRSSRILLFLSSIFVVFISALSDDVQHSKTNAKKAETHAKSSSSTGSKVAVVCAVIVAVGGLSFILYKVWQKKRREEQYARLLKLFEEDDELELELGLRD